MYLGRINLNLLHLELGRSVKKPGIQFNKEKPPHKYLLVAHVYWSRSKQRDWCPNLKIKEGILGVLSQWGAVDLIGCYCRRVSLLLLSPTFIVRLFL